VPHIIETFQGPKARQKALEAPPFGPGLATNEAIDRLELWGSSFSDPGGDWCEWRAFNYRGEKLISQRTSGY